MEDLNYDLFLKDLSKKFCLDELLLWENNKFEDMGIDSLSLVSLLGYIEERYHIKITPNIFSNISTPIQLFNYMVDIKRKSFKKQRDYSQYGYAKIETLNELINYSARLYGEKTAFVFKEKRIGDISKSYLNFYYDVQKIKSYILDKYGEEKNVALLGKNSYEWIVTFFAICCSNNIAVVLDSELPSYSIHILLQKSNSTVIFYDNEDNCLKKKIKEITSGINYEICDYIRPVRLNREENIVSKEIKVHKDNAAVIIYTSGTTGTNKGVTLSHYNLISNVTSFCREVYMEGKTVLTLPLHHAFGMTIVLFVGLYCGQLIYISEGLHSLLQEIRFVKPNSLSLVPMLVEVVEKAVVERTEQKFSLLSDYFLNRKVSKFLEKIIFNNILKDIKIDVLGENLAYIISGGAVFNNESATRLSRFGIQVLNGYGTTECSPCISINRVDNDKWGSVGKILSCNIVKINNSTFDEEGEILVKGDNIMLGYYNEQEVTKSVLSEGYYKTGDIGIIKDGFLFLRGRCKNMILLRNGLNIIPEELEDIIKGLDYIDEVLVYEEAEQIVAEVFGKDVEKCSRIYEDILLINAKLPNYKHIRKIKIRDEEFRKTAVGKIRRETNDKR